MWTPAAWPPAPSAAPDAGAPIAAPWPRGAAAFEVEEVAAYAPSGEGEHGYLWVEKRDLAAGALLAAVGRWLRMASRQVGYAGLKDTWATTRQWLSVPRAALLAAGLEPASCVGAAVHPQVQILASAWHRNRLRCGHLRGNRFRLAVDGIDAAGRATLAARAARLAAAGMANFFGPQRFGPGGGNVAAGRALMAAAVAGGPPPSMPGWRRRLLASAVQSALFNRVLARRLEEGSDRRAQAGDVMRVTASGGLFVCDDAVACQARLDAHELDIAGPMFGPSMVAAAGAPRATELAALADLGLDESAFAALRRLTQGARRPLRVRPEAAALVDGPGGRPELLFGLPAGSYATVAWHALGLVEPPVGTPPAAAMGRPHEA